MGIGSRKRGGRVAREEQMAFPPEDGAQREALIARLFDGVLRSARSQLLRAESPLAAEVWGSGLLSVWDGLQAATGEEPPAGVFTEALIRRAQDLGTQEAMAVLCALAAVGPTRVATRARTAAAALEQAGIAAPVWAGLAGTAVPTEAWIGSDVYGDQEIVIVGFAYPGLADDPGHSICVLVDHTERGIAKDAYPAAPLPQTLARWREAEGDGIGLRPASLPEMRALLASRLNTMPPAAAVGVEELDTEGREWLVAEFLGAPEAADLLSEPAAVTVCHSLIAYRCEYGDGDPLRWSPTLGGLCLLDHFPVKVSLDEPDLALVPDVLAAWVVFSARRRHLPEPALARILDVIDSCREDFPVAMGDVSRYSPAKRAAMDLLRRGIDLTDDHAWAEAVGRN